MILGKIIKSMIDAIVAPTLLKLRIFDLDHSIIPHLKEYGPVVEGFKYSVIGGDGYDDNKNMIDASMKIWAQINRSQKDPSKSILTMVRLDNLTEHMEEDLGFCHDNDRFDLVWRGIRGWPTELELSIDIDVGSNGSNGSNDSIDSKKSHHKTKIRIPRNEDKDSMQIELKGAIPYITPQQQQKQQQQQKKQEIPRIIHQVGGDYIGKPLKVVQKAQILVALKNPTYSHEITSIEEMEAYILRNEGPLAVKAFKSLKPMAFKTDLFRVVALHSKGGVYLDSKLVPLKGMDEILPEKGSFLVKERLNIPGFQSAFMAMVPSDPLMRKAIDAIVNHCHNRFYGNDALEPTGPRLIGECFRKPTIIKREEKYCRRCEFSADAKNILDKNGDSIIIYHNGEYRRMNHLLQGQRHYNELWNRKDIYVDSTASS